MDNFKLLVHYGTFSTDDTILPVIGRRQSTHAQEKACPNIYQVVSVLLDDIRGSPGTSRAKRMRGGEGAPPRIKTKAATAKQLPSELHLTKCISTMAAVSKLLFSTQINVKVRN